MCLRDELFRSSLIVVHSIYVSLKYLLKIMFSKLLMHFVQSYLVELAGISATPLIVTIIIY